MYRLSRNIHLVDQSLYFAEKSSEAAMGWGRAAPSLRAIEPIKTGARSAAKNH
jgi:hypothetical protein